MTHSRVTRDQATRSRATRPADPRPGGPQPDGHGALPETAASQRDDPRSQASGAGPQKLGDALRRHVEHFGDVTPGQASLAQPPRRGS